MWEALTFIGETPREYAKVSDFICAVNRLIDGFPEWKKRFVQKIKQISRFASIFLLVSDLSFYLNGYFLAVFDLILFADLF